MEYEAYVETLRNTEPELAQTIAPFRSLESVFKWMKQRGIDLSAMEVITQDEYTHEVLVPLDQARRYVVFGIT